jgi:subtilase family serine protease
VHGIDNSDAGLVSALNYAVNNNLGDVVSMSFGESDQCLGTALTNAWHNAFVNATKKGITLFASSGDQGSSQPSCDGTSWIQSTSSPASDPLVTGVGGTELIASGWDPCATPRDTTTCTPTGGLIPGSWLSETTWNEGPTGNFSNVFGTTEATGGGYSTIWSEPAYQQGTIHGGKTRAVPDVAYNAAILHGVLVPLPEFGGIFRFGGTSCGSPQWAGLMAIADQMHGSDYGFVNAALYKVGQSAPSYATAFHDITVGQNNALELDSNGNPVFIPGFNAGTGWDATTGLGSPLSAGGLFTQFGQVWSAGQGNAAIQNSKNG